MPETSLARRALPALLIAASASFAGSQPSTTRVAAPQIPAPAESAPYSTAGYLDDRQCGTCHRPIYDSYQKVGMARSFFRPRPERRIEDFSIGFFHEASERHYEIEPRNEGLIFRRYQLGDSGERTNTFEQPIDWILGSGNHSRTYVYQTDLGELYQLPLAWYTQTSSWGMAPGFDRPSHLGVTRKITRECMFCHNAYPENPEGADHRWQPHLFPKSLPEGTGCQRCHGPGAQHMNFAFTGLPDEQVRAAIVNPGKLPSERRDAVCFSCHLQPSVAMPGLRHFDRGDYSFRPGEALDSYLVQVDIVEANQLPSERFEINHHPYRLMQSKCYQESGRDLSCLTCHDPHRKVPVAERAAHYRAACLECHQPNACRLEEMQSGAPSGIAAGDCVTCHMPKRRTQDVVNVVMTDHTIRKHPGGPELLDPLERREPEITGIDILRPDEGPQGVQREVYRAAAVLRVAASGEAATHLARALESEPSASVVPYLDLASAQLHLHRFEKASVTLEKILQRQPEHPLALAWLAVSKASTGQLEEALAIGERAVSLDPTKPAAHFNLGHFLLRANRNAEAADYLSAAVTLRPTMAVAWLYLGEAERRLGRLAPSAAAFERASEVEPTLGRAYLGLGEVLLEQGDRAGAIRVWRHGSRFARQPEEIRTALANLKVEP